MGSSGLLLRDSVSLDISDAITAYKQAGIVIIIVDSIQVAAGQGYTSLGFLPTGWRPARYIAQAATITDHTKPSFVDVRPTGEIKLQPYQPSKSGYAYSNIVFPAYS